jgi:hypothetical protein
LFSKKLHIICDLKKQFSNCKFLKTQFSNGLFSKI